MREINDLRNADRKAIPQLLPRLRSGFFIVGIIAEMTAAYRVTVAERQDLIPVTIVCPECSSSVTVKIDTAQTPERCASCNRPFDEKTISAISALGRFHREAQAAESINKKQIFRFEIREKSI